MLRVCNDRPDLLRCALIAIEDGCPPEQHMQLCQLEDADDGSACIRCWKAYLYYVANGRGSNPYGFDRLHEGGMIGA